MELERDHLGRILKLATYDDSSLDQLWQTLVKHTRLNGASPRSERDVEQKRRT